MARRTVTTNEEAKKKRDLFKKSSETVQFSQEAVDLLNDWLVSKGENVFTLAGTFSATIYSTKADKWGKKQLPVGQKLLLTGIYRSEKTGNTILRFHQVGSGLLRDQEIIELKLSEASAMLMGFDDTLTEILTHLGISEQIGDYAHRVEQRIVSEQDKKLNQFANYKNPVNGIECGSW